MLWEPAMPAPTIMLSLTSCCDCWFVAECGFEVRGACYPGTMGADDPGVLEVQLVQCRGKGDRCWYGRRDHTRLRLRKMIRFEDDAFIG